MIERLVLNHLVNAEKSTTARTVMVCILESWNHRIGKMRNSQRVGDAYFAAVNAKRNKTAAPKAEEKHTTT